MNSTRWFRPVAGLISTSGERGTTLVEVMAASFILSLTFFAVVAMIRKARDLEYEGNAYFQARLIANSILERPGYHYSNYGTLASPKDSVYPALDRPVINVSDSRFVDIELRVTTTSGNEAAGDWNGVVVPYKRIEAIVSWNNGANSISSAKRITEIQ